MDFVLEKPSSRIRGCGKLWHARPARDYQRFATGMFRWLLFLILPFSFSLFPSVQAQDAPADNWSQFRGNLNLTGVSQSNVPQNIRHLWTYEAGDSIESSAAIVGGTVFVGSQKGELTALNLENGAAYWKYKIDDPIGESSPAYSRGVVYIGDLGGWLHAVNATDGKKIWAFKAGTEIKSSPVVVGDRVLIGSYDQHLYCVSARNGALLWKLKTNGAVHSTPSVAGDLAFIAGCDELFRGGEHLNGQTSVQRFFRRLHRRIACAERHFRFLRNLR